MDKQKGNVFLIVLLIAAAIGGYLIYSGKVNLPQKQTEQTQTTSVDETANWKTYTNPEYKYTLKYLPEMTMKLYEKTVQFTYQPQDLDQDEWFYLSVLVIDNPKRLSTEEYIKNYAEERKKKLNETSGNSEELQEFNNSIYQTILDSFKPYKNNQIDGMIGDIDGFENPNITVIESKEDRIYEFHLLPGFGTGAQVMESHKALFDQILSTFKFTQ